MNKLVTMDLYPLFQIAKHNVEQILNILQYIFSGTFDIIFCIRVSKKVECIMTYNPSHMPSFLKKFRSMKLEMIIQDLPKLNTEQLEHLKQEIEKILALKK